MADQTSIFSVYGLNQYISSYLAGSRELQNVTVRGELSNVHPYKNMLFFSLKDESSSMNAVLFNASSVLRFPIENGTRVICSGFVTVYVPDGRYQLQVRQMMPDGKGAMALAFAQLKERLSKEGLFAQEHKKKIPEYPFRVGLITSANHAAVMDVQSVIQRRFPAAEILLAPSTVQGANAPGEIIRALRILDTNKLCDVILIARGGGSSEDLDCFNDEGLARAVYACETPVISGVGHEIDETILDYVADLRAPTPSVAAERAVPDQAEILQSVRALQRQIRTNVTRSVSQLEQRLQSVTSRPVLSSPHTFFIERTSYISSLRDRLNNALIQDLDRKEQRLNALITRPVLLNPQGFINEREQSLARLDERLNKAASVLLDRKTHNLQLLVEKMTSLNPLSVLDRGFALALAEDGSVIRKAADLPNGARFQLRLAEGAVNAASEGPADQ